MGMYDTVSFRCPKCENLLTTQSKAGECALSTFQSSCVPEPIGSDLLGGEVRCPECDKLWRIVSADIPKVVRLGLVEAP